MKLTLFFVLTALSRLALAEKVEVYSCATKSFDIAWGERGDEDSTTFLTFHRMREKLGDITTGASDLSKIVADAKAHNRSMDPFYGGGFYYLLKDAKGAYYIAFFEYETGHKEALNGIRMAIKEARLTGNVPNVFEGSPLQDGGSCFDAGLLKQLKILTQK